MIIKQQFGFRRGRLYVTSLLSFNSGMMDIMQERNGWTDCVYLDLKKAFDKVAHRKLLWKLKHNGWLRGALLR